MIYSKTCEYAIRALGYLASRADKTPATTAEVSAEAGVPQAYVAKIFQCLVRAQILDSKSGPGGGYFFRVEPSKLTLLGVIRALDDLSQSPLTKCVMGQTKCNDKDPCPLHDIWAKAKEEMNQRLGKETILDVASNRNVAYWNKKRRVMLSRRMQNVFGYSVS